MGRREKDRYLLIYLLTHLKKENYFRLQHNPKQPHSSPLNELPAFIPIFLISRRVIPPKNYVYGRGTADFSIITCVALQHSLQQPIKTITDNRYRP